MTAPFRPLPDLSEATRLTRAGRLTDAVAAIQAALGGAAPSPAVPTPLETSAAQGPNAPNAPTARPPRLRLHRPRVPKGLVRASLLAAALAPAQALADALAPAPALAQAPLPGEVTRHRLDSPHGARDYLLFLPSQADGPLPLVILLHGCTQSPDDFLRGTRMAALAEARGFAVAAPAQPRQANPSLCWNWFLPGHQGRGVGEPAILADLIDAVAAQADIDRDRVGVAGLSAGGAMALAFAAAYPDRVAGVAVHSGLAVGSARDVGSAFAAMGHGAPGTEVALPPTLILQGTADATVAAANAAAIAAQAGVGAIDGGRLDATTETGRSAGGRAWTRTRHADRAGAVRVETWLIDGAPHAWAGGDAGGTYTDPAGPDASAIVTDFLLAQHL